MHAFSATAFLLLWERNPGVIEKQIIQTQSDNILLWTLEFYFVSLYTLWMTFTMNLFKSASSAPGIGNIRNHPKVESLKTLNINYLYQLSQSLNTFLKKKKKTNFVSPLKDTTNIFHKIQYFGVNKKLGDHQIKHLFWNIQVLKCIPHYLYELMHFYECEQSGFEKVIKPAEKANSWLWWLALKTNLILLSKILLS